MPPLPQKPVPPSSSSEIKTGEYDGMPIYVKTENAAEKKPLPPLRDKNEDNYRVLPLDQSSQTGSPGSQKESSGGYQSDYDLEVKPENPYGTAIPIQATNEPASEYGQIPRSAHSDSDAQAPSPKPSTLKEKVKEKIVSAQNEFSLAVLFCGEQLKKIGEVLKQFQETMKRYREAPKDLPGASTKQPAQTKKK